MTVVQLPHVPSMLEPVVYTVPLQLLAYHVAVMKGTDVDQPRNLAKSVTVEYRCVGRAMRVFRAHRILPVFGRWRRIG